VERTPEAWSVTAVNLPEHAANAIHTDAGASAAGFPAALVAGVTTYAYLTHPCVAAWGEAWLGGSVGELRLRAPVFAGDTVDCVPRSIGPSGAVDETVIEAICRTRSPEPRATLAVSLERQPAPAGRPGESLPSRSIELTGLFGNDYGLRAGDDLAIYAERGLAHPGVWPAIANLVYASHLVRGAWIHTHSVIRHHSLVPDGVTVDAHANVVERFTRGGLRAVTEFVFERAGQVVVTLEHEAIVELDPPERVP
jgi:acyl dehydratase